MRWLVRNFGVGLLVTVVALVIPAIATAVFDLPWSWSSVALALLAAGAFLILVLLTRPGVNPPGLSLGFDPHDAFVETIGHEASGTLTDYRPSQGGIEALLNM